MDRKVKIVQYGSIALSIVAMIGTAWAADKNTTRTLEKLVAEHTDK